jgi:hypothetical protein
LCINAIVAIHPLKYFVTACFLSKIRWAKTAKYWRLSQVLPRLVTLLHVGHNALVSLDWAAIRECLHFVSASWVVVADIFRMVAGGQRINRVRIRIF